MQRRVFGLDQEIASLASGKPLIALAVALLLGLRHPLDPDHLAAVAAMARDSRRRSALVGLWWGIGHASTVLLLGVPVVLWTAALPDGVHEGIEALIGVVIFALGLRLLIRHGRGELHAHPHNPPRSLSEAYAVGVVHGAGGSAAIALLILAAIPAHGVALAGLLVFATSTALAMSAVAAGLGRGLRALPAAPVGGLVCIFGLWYLTAAGAGAPYPF
jgi:High-affinity nickel-transport protein